MACLGPSRSWLESPSAVSRVLANNLVITYLHVPPIIATLGTFFIIEGINIQITGGLDILPLPTRFQTLGQGDIVGVPYIVIYAVVVGVLFWFRSRRPASGSTSEH